MLFKHAHPLCKKFLPLNSKCTCCGLGQKSLTSVANLETTFSNTLLKWLLWLFILWEEKLRQRGHFVALFPKGTKRSWFKERWLQFVIAGGSWREKVNSQEMCVGMQIESKEHQWLWARSRNDRIAERHSSREVGWMEMKEDRGCRKEIKRNGDL